MSARPGRWEAVATPMRGAAVIPVTTPRTSVQELARRVADGVEVTLLWSKRTNTVFLRV